MQTAAFPTAGFNSTVACYNLVQFRVQTTEPVTHSHLRGLSPPHLLPPLPGGEAYQKPGQFCLLSVNPLDSKGNYSGTANKTKLVHWPLMGGLLDLVQRGGASAAPFSPLHAVPNVTSHPSTASVPITV